MNLRTVNPEQGSALFLVGAVAMGLGSLSMMRPSPPRDLPTTREARLYGAALASLHAGRQADEIPVDAVLHDDDDGYYEEADEELPPHLLDLPAPNVVLVATSVSADPDLHRAAFRRREGEVSKLYFPGDRLDHHVVERVDRRAVTLVAPDGTRWTYQLSYYPDEDLEPVRAEAPSEAPQ